MSMPMPGWRITVGSMPQRRAASRCGKKLSSPKRSGTTSGGEQSTALEPRSSCAGDDGEGWRRRVRREHRVDLGRRDGGMSPGIVSMPPRPSRGEDAQARPVTPPVWPSRAPSVTTRAP